MVLKLGTAARGQRALAEPAFWCRAVRALQICQPRRESPAPKKAQARAESPLWWLARNEATDLFMRSKWGCEMAEVSTSARMALHQLHLTEEDAVCVARDHRFTRARRVCPLASIADS